eukprot:3314337-Alexandrium_andersonii.AAC.1
MMLWDIAGARVRIDTVIWYERVASASNPADAPSRLDFDEPRRLFGAVVDTALVEPAPSQRHWPRSLVHPPRDDATAPGGPRGGDPAKNS